MANTLQDIIDALIDHIDKAITKGSVTNKQVAAVLDFFNEKIKSFTPDDIKDLYLRKDIEDWAKALEHFLEGIDVKGTATTEKLKVTEDAVFEKSASSKDFVSGFLTGKGWAILLREFLNAAGIKEFKSYAEFDEVVIRNSLKVFEMIINQLKGESDNYIFSGMMKIDHVDTDNKKLYLDTGGGLLYNTFRTDDYLVCQRYGGMPTGTSDYNITKSYEFVVVNAGSGNITDGEKRLDWITYQDFIGNESDIEKGDIVVRVDNMTNQDRKGIIQNVTVGAFAPYSDVTYGLKTNPGSALKSRRGRLDGVFNEWFGGWLKGFGDYIINLYAIGEFHFRNGENVQTRLDIVENLFRVALQKSTYNMTEEDNFFTNATFTESLDGWTYENNIQTFTVNGKLMMFNRNLYVAKNSVAGIEEYAGRNMLRIKNSWVKQANANIRKPDDPANKLYLSFKYICKSGGTLRCGFEKEGQRPEGELPFITESIPEGNEFQIKDYSGTWDGKGDFILAFTGDIYIDLLSLTNNPLDDFKITVSTQFKQTAESIELLGKKVDNTNKTVSDLGIELNATKEDIRIWGEKTNTNTGSITGLGIDLDLAKEKLTLYAGKTDKLEGTVSDIGIRLSAAEGKLDLFANFKDQINGTVSNLGIRMSAAEGKLDLFANFKDQVNGTVSNLGIRMNAAEGKLDQFATFKDNTTGTITNLRSRMDAAEGKFSNYVLTDTLNAVKGDINNVLDRHWSAIEQTDRDLLLSINKATGYLLYKDLQFTYTNNGIALYNNSGGNAVTVIREEILKDTKVYQMKISKIVGNSSPGLGGFCWANQSRANAVFESRFTAKIPKGYHINYASNAHGDGAKDIWITDTAGTDDWVEYKHQVFCGKTGTFSSISFFYLTKDPIKDQANDDYNTIVTWYIKQGTVFDLSGYEDPVTYINLTENMAKIKAKRIEFEGLVTANEYFKIREDGSVEARKGTFKNVIIQGSIRSPFVRETDSIVIGGEQSTHDNVAAISDGGGWITAGALEWDVAQAGRRMCITNYRWGNQISEGTIQYSAPSGKFFYEDGINKSAISLSRECVELMGYGTDTQFYGWIVLNRIDLMTANKYGSCKKVLFAGEVSDGNMARQKTFDGSKLTSSKLGTGSYRVNFPYSMPHSSYAIHLTGYVSVRGNDRLYACTVVQNPDYFTVYTGDDSSPNDGGFMYEVISTADWE